NAGLQIAFFSVANPGVSASPTATFESPTVYSGNNWQQFLVTSAAAPEGTQAVRFTLTSYAAQQSNTDWYGTGSAYFDNVDAAAVPEPTSLLLLGSGLVGLMGLGKKKKA
ncbi:MAG: PEP-CTERM sorting domain-containing protein, partial [Candidatus Omnitrophica bacterium]|nr:PEP-CTERM sorting domain-containing protein [Candidatus Omnitrophota bacterium]